MASHERHCIGEYENMAYKNYNLWLVIRIILLLGNVFLTGSTYLLIGQRDLLFLPAVLTLVLMVQVVDIILYLNRLSKEITRFVSNLSQQDLSEKFEEKSLGPPFRELYHSLNKVVSELEGIKLEKEAQYNYLQVILGNVPTGIISVRDNDEIVLLNDSARELLKLSEHSSWADVELGHPGLASEINKIRGRGKRLVEVKVNGALRHLSVNVSSVRVLGSRYRIISLQDIRTEIEQKEIEAWHKLIQILRHEIRNSVTPIASMSETILMLVEDQLGNTRKPAELGEQDLADLHSSIRTVHERSERLYQFVEKYRQLTKVPPPENEMVPVQDLFRGMLVLFRKESEPRHIQLLSDRTDDRLAIDADPSLVEQVLINLVKNSMHALEGVEDGIIKLSAKETNQHVILCVEDNGPGIDPDALQDIFLPFYTTREEGMGIGLSLSRQIMNLHGGILTVDSQPGEKTVFSLVFNK